MVRGGMKPTSVRVARKRTPAAVTCYRCRKAAVRATSSAEPDVCFLDHLAPQSHLLLHEGPEFLRRCGADINIELLEAAHDIRITKRGIKPAIERLHDLAGRATWHENAVPLVRLEARQRFRCGRNVRQTGEPALSRMRDGFDLAALDKTHHG